MNSQASLSEIAPGQFRLEGTVSVDTVAALQQPGYKVLDGVDMRAEFDFSQVNIVGSAVISLLISWQRYAATHDVALVFTHAPASLLAIAEVSGVRDILSFE